MGKIAVLGLGASLNLYEGGYDAAIGVNDIWRYVETEYIVCVDRPDRFTPERWEAIRMSRPTRFYSQLDDYFGRPDFYRIELQPMYPNHVCQLNIPALPKSFCSPFIAAAIAFKYHAATEIHVYGVDLVNHPLLNIPTCQRIKEHFRALKIALAVEGCQLVIHGDGILKPLNNLGQ